MSKFFALLLCSFFSLTALAAQPVNTYSSTEDSDPAAKKIVEEIQRKYDGYSSLQADFRLDLEFPGQAVETQKGTLKRSGDKFRFQLGKQEGVSDGKAVYVILHDNKEIQINNMPEPGEEGAMLTPDAIFSIYEQGDYILALQGEEKENGRVRQVIEMKPSNSAESEFTKLRMVIDKAAKQPVRLLAFSRDGSRFTFHLDKVRTNPTLSASDFVFSKSDYPGYYVEDLRF